MHQTRHASARVNLFPAVILALGACGLSVAGPTDPGVLLSLPMDPQSARETWELPEAGDFFGVTVVEDEILGRKVLDVRKVPGVKGKGARPPSSFVIRSKESVSGAYVVEALVRFPDDPAAAVAGGPHKKAGGGAKTKVVLACGTGLAESGAVPAYCLEGGTGIDRFSWNAKRGRERAMPARKKDAGQAANNENTQPPWGATGGLTPNLNASQVSPFSPEAFRLELEAGLAALPVPHRTWIPLRMEVRRNLVRLYFNGALVLEGPHTEKSDGPVMLELLDHARVAGLEVRRVEDSPSPFVTVPLDFRCNATGPIDLASLDQPRHGVKVGGIPFTLASDGSPNDHVDIGQSVYRYRMGTKYTSEYDHRATTPRPFQFDPSRIMLVVPRRAYTRAWVLAGADDRPNHAPILTLRFFKPHTGWATDAAVTVPALTAQSAGAEARPVTVKASDGKPAHLWVVPIELNTAELAADFRGDTLDVELTKEVKPNVAYPDPNNYSYQAGGLPSGVRLYGLTFEESPVWAVGTSSVRGNVYTAPETPTWQVTIRSQTAGDLPVTVRIDVTDPYGKPAEPVEKKIVLKPGDSQTPSFPLQTTVHGLHTVRTTVSAGTWSQSREGTLLMLPAAARRATGKDSPWGVWDWANGGHETNPDKEENARLLKALGAINHFHLEGRASRTGEAESLDDFRAKWGLGADHDRIVPRTVPAWGAKDPVDPADYAAYKAEIGERARMLLGKHPDFQYVNCFAENSVSLRLTHGVPPWAFGLPDYTYTDVEKSRIRQMLTVATAAAEGVRQQAPGVKFLFGHGAPNFPLPFFRESTWNPDLFAGFGLDMPQFERMPERQPRATEPSLLYFLRKELRDRGWSGKELVHLESYFPSSHELALGHRGQADSIVRTAVLSLALGTTKFMHTWSLYDCADRWGNQHYGCVGLIGRLPECNAKPAAAAFATMTRVLDSAAYDGWLETGSRGTFCVRFKAADRLVHAAWTIRGSRPIELTPDSDAVQFVKIDENGNEFPLAIENGRASVTVTSTPLWIVTKRGGIKTAVAGTPAYTEPAGANTVVLEDFDKAGWTLDARSDERYEGNNWDVVRLPVRMTQEHPVSAERKSTVLRVTMAERPAGKPCVGFYGVLVPPKPIPIPGRARALRVHGKGRSQWHRLVYELTDAKGEAWLSCGQKNAWNSDDIHSWSYFNHDGWRSMEFPVPATSPGDNYREKSCYSWGHSDDGIVDLPLTLTKIIVEMRTDMIYVNEMLPVDDLSIELDDLVAVYDAPDDMTDKPVTLQVAARDAWRPKITASPLPNPIKNLTESGAGEAPAIEKVYPPEVMDAGDQVFVKVKPVEGARSYCVYVSAYPDGTGAQAAGKPEKDPTTIFVKGLQPAIPMYFFASYTDKDGRESKPSPARKTVLKDEFPFK